MKFEIEDPLQLLLEFTYVSALLSDKEIPELENINKLSGNIMGELKQNEKKTK